MSDSLTIVSLVPSLTELLFDLDLDDQIRGRTRFCIHPEKKVSKVPIVGGTKNPNLEKILEIAPDLIIASREENRKEDIEILEESCDILLTDISSVEDALLVMYEIGKCTDREEKAALLIDKIRDEMEQIPDEPVQRVAYFIWRDPWMTIGHDTYIHSVLNLWNLENVYGMDSRYPKTSLNELSEKNPDWILLSSEPYPFKEKHQKEIEKVYPGARVLLVDGEWFSWYGSRMLPSFRKLNAFRKAIS